jgi:ribosomal protein L24E
MLLPYLAKEFYIRNTRGQWLTSCCKLQGKLYIRGDSKIFRFQNGKTESLFLQRKNPRRIAWTTLYRRMHKKGISEVSTPCSLPSWTDGYACCGIIATTRNEVWTLCRRTTGKHLQPRWLILLVRHRKLRKNELDERSSHNEPSSELL